MGIGPGHVEVVLIERGLGEELGARSKGFQIIELIFDEAVNGFDVALEGMSGGWDALMLAITEGGRETRARTVGLKLADEFAAVISLPSQMAEFDAASSQVSLNAGGEAGASGSGAVGSESQELQAAADLAGGVLNGGQVGGLGLGPIAGKVVQILGIGGDLLKEAPGGFHGGQILFALIFFAAAVDEAVSVPDAFQGAVAQGEIELADQSPGAEGGQVAAKLDDLLLDLRRSLMRLMAWSSGMFLQPF